MGNNPRSVELGLAESQRIVRSLDELLNQLGHGSVRELERRLGRASSWWWRLRTNGDMRLSAFFGVCKAEGLDPARLVAEAIDSDWTRLDRLRPPGNPPPIVDAVLQRLDEPGTEAAEVPGVLEELDNEGFRNPQRAVERALFTAEHLPVGQLPGLLGVVGSAYRRWNAQLDAAEHCIRAGLGIVERGKDPLAFGDLLQRLAYVVRDHGQYREGLRIIDRATVVYVGAGAIPQIGMTCVDRGMLLYYLKEIPEAIEAQKRALEYLPEAHVKHRFGALQGLGLYYRELGEPRVALDYVLKADELYPELDLGVWPKAKLLWLLAELAVALSELPMAEGYLREMVDLFQPIHDGETALGTTALVRVLLLQGRSTEALKLSRTMQRLVWGRKNDLISATLLDLVRTEQAVLSLELVELAQKRLEEARERPGWHSLAR